MAPNTSIEVRQLEQSLKACMEGDELSECSGVEDGHADSTSTSTGKTEEDAAKSNREKERLAQEETIAVFRLRVVVIAVLFLAAVAVSLIVLMITTKSEEEEFRTQFEGVGGQVLSVFEAIAEQKVGAVSSLAVATIAHGVDHNRDWPFVTLSSFQQRSATARSLSNALFVAIAPVVSNKNRYEWEDYVMMEDSYWIEQGYTYQEEFGLDQFLAVEHHHDMHINPGSNRSAFGQYPIFYEKDEARYVPDIQDGPYLPIWQTSPVLKRNAVNQDLFRDSLTSEDAKRCIEKGQVVMGAWDTAPVGDISSSDHTTAFYASLLSFAAGEQTRYLGDPMATIYLPIFDSFDGDTRRTVAVLMVTVHWASFFKRVLSNTVNGVDVVLHNSCNGNYTFRIQGEEAFPLGEGDLHQTEYDSLGQSTSFDGFNRISDGTRHGLRLNQERCKYSVHVYPSHEFAKIYKTNNPYIITSSVALIFMFTALMFFIYDRLVERRQRLVLMKATQSSAIVSSLFPENVRDRLLQQNGGTNDGGGFLTPNHRLKTYLRGDNNENDLGVSPIADLFPHSTVLFADIAGFTAWSSTREPAQVFILLQSVYQAFDVVAKKLKVFKVETIGDSYVAVTGLPEPQANHAVIMARFAGECLLRMNQITRELEVTLGPDTGDLEMRIGMHSGPVTAGVLRGDRARFQLFGDTVNTAARMESTGSRSKIQVSQSTADLLTKAGKGSWVRPREDAVLAKGKGVLNTFWLTPHAKKGSVSSTDSASSGNMLPIHPGANADREHLMKHERHIDWIVELFTDSIKKIMATQPKKISRENKAPPHILLHDDHQTALDEVAEMINLPKFDAKVAEKAKKFGSIEIDGVVIAQVRQYVATIASMYRDNPFHSFEHACHVTMAVNKLLKRIVTPDLDASVMAETGKSGNMLASHLHDYTHGINSDPLTIFGIVFSALIHDVDHRGVSNRQLIEEEPSMASHYRNKSVAEQNSLDISWDLLMSDPFKELRACVFSTDDELLRFRQVLINVVLATDIFDKELNDLRRNRWEKAFCGKVEEDEKFNDLRATIVIEHIIQASDVAHTMQHWHVYCKWNRRLFREMYCAYKHGRMAKDPSEFWYEGEIGFFDNYIIPLAKKLKDCNVFGVSSDECLNYALQNRAEWAERGREILEDMMKEVICQDSCPHLPLGILSELQELEEPEVLESEAA